MSSRIPAGKVVVKTKPIVTTPPKEVVPQTVQPKPERSLGGWIIAGLLVITLAIAGVKVGPTILAKTSSPPAPAANCQPQFLGQSLGPQFPGQTEPVANVAPNPVAQSAAPVQQEPLSPGPGPSHPCIYSETWPGPGWRPCAGPNGPVITDWKP